MATADVTIKVELDVTNAPLSSTDTWLDVTSDVDGVVECVHGWARLTKTVAPGTARITFFDPDRDFDPANTAGAHYGKVDRRNKIRISAKGDHQGGYTVIWRGYVERFEPDYGGPEGLAANRTTVYATDIVSILTVDTLPESRWHQTITAQSGVDAWYRWRERGNTTVVVDHSGNVANGVMKRQNADKPNFTNGPESIAETTVYNAFRYTVPGIIPYGSSKDRAYSFAETFRNPDMWWDWEGFSTLLQPARVYAHFPTGLVGGTDWAVSMWVQGTTSTAWDVNGTPSYKKAGTTGAQQLMLIGVDNATEYTFYWDLTWSNGTMEMWYYVINTSDVATKIGPDRSFTVAEDEPHLCTILSIDAGGGLSTIYFDVDGTSFSQGTVGNHPATSQRFQINYPGGLYGQKSEIDVGDVVVYAGTDEPTLVQLDAHYEAGANPDMDASEQLAGWRIGDALDTAGSDAGVPAALRSIDTGLSDLSPTIWDEASIWEYCSKVALSDGGRLFVDETGRVVFRDRNFFKDDTTSSVVQFELRDTGTLAAADIQTADQTWGRDMSTLVNECTVTMEDGEYATDSTASSITDYGRHAIQVDCWLETVAEATNLASWIVAQGDDPQVCIEKATISAHDEDSITALLASCKIGYRAKAYKTMPTTSDLSCEALVASKRWRFQPSGEYSCELGFEPIPTDDTWA